MPEAAPNQQKTYGLRVLSALSIITIIVFSIIIFFVIGLPKKEKGTASKPPHTNTNHTSPPKPISEETEPIKLIFVGDMMPDRFIRQTGEAKGYEYIFDRVAPVLEASNVVIGNLEGPVTTFASVSAGTNPDDADHYVFTFSAVVLPVLSQNNIRIVSIGNNHILNFGARGLEQTRLFLKQNNIEYFGDPDDAARMTLIQHIKNKKIGFVAFNQFISPDEKLTAQQIRDTAASTDFTIVYAHWGEEYESHPGNTQIALARAFIDAGADLVVGAHPHVIQDKEIYKGKTIYYSLGNFVFDQYFSERVRCGAVISVTLSTQDSRYTTEEYFSHLEKDGSTAISNCASDIPRLPQKQ